MESLLSVQPVASASNCRAGENGGKTASINDIFPPLGRADDGHVVFPGLTQPSRATGPTGVVTPTADLFDQFGGHCKSTITAASARNTRTTEPLSLTTAATPAVIKGLSPALQGCIAGLQKYMADCSVRNEEKESVAHLITVLGHYVSARLAVKQHMEEGESLLRQLDELHRGVESAAAAFRTATFSLTESPAFTSLQQQQHLALNCTSSLIASQRGRGRVEMDLAECKETLARVRLFAQNLKKLRDDQHRICEALEELEKSSPSNNSLRCSSHLLDYAPQETRGLSLLDDLHAAANTCIAQLRQVWEEVITFDRIKLLRGLKEHNDAERTLAALKALCEDTLLRLSTMRGRIARLGSNRVEEAGKLEEHLATLDSYDPMVEEHETRRRQIDAELATVKGWLETVSHVQRSAVQLSEALHSGFAVSDCATHVTHPQTNPIECDVPKEWHPFRAAGSGAVEECVMSSVASSTHTADINTHRATYPLETPTTPAPVHTTRRVAGTLALPNGAGSHYHQTRSDVTVSSVNEGAVRCGSAQSPPPINIGADDGGNEPVSNGPEPPVGAGDDRTDEDEDPIAISVPRVEGATADLDAEPMLPTPTDVDGGKGDEVTYGKPESGEGNA
ncbi:unnamed protein product, partial [Trypanosoma congolense IL3000]